MKLFEHPEAEKTRERLPELPPGVEVPDDISGLRAPTTLKPTAGRVRWMRWLAAIVVLGAGGVVAAMLLSGSDADPAPIDYMAIYGTDNPVILQEDAVARSVEIVAPGPSSLEQYGTDNPVVVPGAAVADNATAADFMTMVGTDNPVFVAETARPGTVEIVTPGPSSMEQYGTDNPVFVSGAAVADNANAGDFMRMYGTDNPVFVPGPSSMELYGTDNPVIVEP